MDDDAENREMVGENLKKNDLLRCIGADWGGYWEVGGMRAD